MCRVFLALAALVPVLAAAPQGGGEPAPGFRMYGPHGTTETYLLDTSGTVVHTWPGGYEPGNGVYLLADGTLLRSGKLPGGPAIGGLGGNVQRIAFDGTVLWDYDHGSATYWAHHDIEPLPSGNVLIIVWDLMTDADAIAAGRDPFLLGGTDWFPDSIVEVEPSGPTGGTVVWEWHVRDHLIQDFDATKANFGVVADHPELLDVNHPPAIVSNGDWNHANSISYDPASDLILFNANFQDEYYILDHSTTTAEAAGHTGGAHGKGGDILYRWGNPAAYDAGTPADQETFRQHGTAFIPAGLPGAGNVILFNNRLGPDFSAVFEVELPKDPGGGFSLLSDGTYGPAGPVWEYMTPVPTDFYSSGLSNAERLPNGNTLIDSGRQAGGAWFFEVTEAKEKVWEHFNQLPTQDALVFQIGYYERTLWADRESVSTSAGGTIEFDLVAGTAHAGSEYRLLGSLAGTEPGISSDGHVLPLNVDFYFLYMWQNPGGPLHPGSSGTLDALGRAQASAVLPPGLAVSLAGMTAHHAFGVIDPLTSSVTLTSNAVPLELLP